MSPKAKSPSCGPTPPHGNTTVNKSDKIYLDVRFCGWRTTSLKSDPTDGAEASQTDTGAALALLDRFLDEHPTHQPPGCSTGQAGAPSLETVARCRNPSKRSAKRRSEADVDVGGVNWSVSEGPTSRIPTGNGAYAEREH